MNSKINIITWNARGVRHKKHELFQFVMSNNVQICLLTETWLDSNVSLSHSAFNCYRCDRASRGGGVAILVSKSVPHQLLPIVNTSTIENIGIRIATAVGPLDIFACYFAGGAAGRDGNKKRQFSSDLERMCNSSRKYLLGGDFNCRNRSWGCTRANCWGNILDHKLTTNNVFIKYPADPTYVPSSVRSSASTLDIYLTNMPAFMSTPTVVNDLSSDHLPVQIFFNQQIEMQESLKYIFSKANWARYSNYLKRVLRENNYDVTADVAQIDQMISYFNDAIKRAVDVSVPKKRVEYTHVNLPTEIKRMITSRNYYRRKWIRYRHNRDKSIFKILNTAIAREINIVRNKNWSTLLKSLNKGSLPFWNIAKVLKRKSKIIPTLISNGQKYTTSNEKCNVLSKTFEFNHMQSNNLSDNNTVSVVERSIELFQETPVEVSDNFLVTENYIKCILKSLKPKKAPGIDGVSNIFLKNLPKIGITVLTNIINSCLKACYFPKIWKEAKIIAICKPKKPHDAPSSYRPISLLSSISKVLEKVLKEKLTNYNDSNNIIPNEQYGFRNGLCTIHPLKRISKFIKSNFNQGKSTGMILLDIKAAFDSVWHKALIYKMIRHRFPNELVCIIQSFLKDRSFKVHIGKTTSDLISIPAGCPQGSCLSPLLYNIFTSDFPPLDNCIASIFADDTAILNSNIYAADVISNLESALLVVENYFSKWNILVNVQKTQAIFFSRRRKPCFVPQRCIRSTSTEIQWDEKVKYLGVILDPKLTFKHHTSYVIDKIKTTIHILYPFINRNSHLCLGNKLIIFKVIFQSILFYATPVWGDAALTHIKRLQIQQNKVLKMIYNLPRLFSTSRLHALDDIETVLTRTNRLKDIFANKCQSSEFSYLNDLAI